VLQAVTGRVLSSLDSARQEQGPVFAPTHEELRRSALRRLSGELDRWRERLHAWADGYRKRGRPADTPEYLLRGHLKMLLEAGDLPRMVESATDRARLDRMLDGSGDNAAARRLLAACLITLDPDSVLQALAVAAPEAVAAVAADRLGADEGTC